MRMNNIETKINDFIDELSHEHDLFRYNYNTKSQSENIDKVYYSGPYWDKKEITAIFKSVLLGKWLSSGEAVHKFEKEFSKKFCNGYSLMVNSGSSANLVMIAACKKFFGWQDGDEIIVSAVGFPTTIAPIIQNNLKPVFVDIEFETLNFDLFYVRKAITSRTRAIFLSPVLGNPPDMKTLDDICRAYDIKLILDNCDSLGSKWKSDLKGNHPNGFYLNEFAAASSCSFYPAHHITTGEGGMISSNHQGIIETARSIAWWGRDCYCVGAANLLPKGTCGKRFSNWLEGYDNEIDHKYIFNNIGYNLKPLDLQGAIGLVQLDKFEEIHKKRVESKNTIHKLLNKHLPYFYVPDAINGNDVSWFGTPIVCETVKQKHHFVNYLEKHNIQTRNYFAGNILLHPAYKQFGDSSLFPNSNQVLNRVFFIGAAPHYNEHVFNYLEKVFKEYSEQYCTCNVSITNGFKKGCIKCEKEVVNIRPNA